MPLVLLLWKIILFLYKSSSRTTPFIIPTMGVWGLAPMATQALDLALSLQQPQILAGEADDYALLAGEQAGGDALGVALLELLGGVVGRHEGV